MNPRVEGVLIDIDNTVYVYEPAHRAALDAALDCLASLCGLSTASLEEYYNCAKELTHRNLAYTAASHNRLLYFQRMCEVLGLAIIPNAYHLYDLYWDAFFDAMRLDEGVVEFLESLGIIPVCWITDFTSDIQFRKISRLGLGRFARFMVTSEEAGVEKPHPRPFQLALGKLGLNPESVCIIGDHYEKDAMGGMDLGMSAIWLNRAGIPRPGREGLVVVGSFVELNKLCWNND